MNGLAATVEPASAVASVAALEAFCRSVLLAEGADEPTATDATRAMMHGSRLGVDSHGVRLLDHYAKVIRGGRIDPCATPRLVERRGAVAVLEAGNAHGARAAYAAMREAVGLATELGIGAVSIRNTSHFGPAGAYALAAAEAGSIGISMCNSDSFVRLHDGAQKFHGTNPIAIAVPLAGEQPWLLDMATSAITYNRVQLFRSLGEPLPEGTGSTSTGEDTTDPGLVEMLAPLGDAFGFKGAALAGAIDIFSAVLSGMRTSADILPMAGPDLSTPRQMGAFVMAINPDAFVDRAVFDDGMRRYVDSLRNSPSRAGAKVMAPGDREWVEARRRQTDGIPIDPATAAAFRRLAQEHGIEPPLEREKSP